MKNWTRVAQIVGAATIAAAAACGGDGRGDIETNRYALTSAETDRVLGFESPSTDWSVQTGAVSASTIASQGTRALAIQAQGWTPIQSVALSSLGARVGNPLQVDVWLPTAQPNQWWYGAIYAAISGAGLASETRFEPADGIDLTKTQSDPSLMNPLGQWFTVTFSVPSALQARLAATDDDLRFSIILNVPGEASGTYLIDNLRFVGGSAPTPDAGAGIADAGAPTADGGQAGGGDTGIGCVPPVPSGLAATADDASVHLTWNVSWGATGYVVARTDGDGQTALFPVSEPTYTDTGLTNGRTYGYSVAAQGSCGDSATSEAVSATPTAPTVITLRFPKGVGRDSVALGANGSLRINDGAEVLDVWGRPVSVSNAGEAETNVGATTVVKSVTSVGPIVLRSNAHVAGDATTSGTVTKQDGVRVDGNTVESASLTPTDEFSWAVTLPVTNQGDRILQPDADQSLSPGAYANVTANSRAKLRLTAGTYYVTSLDLEPQASLYLDRTNGPIMMYVTGNVVLRGGMVSVSGQEGDFLLVVLGDQTVSVAQHFTGTIVAPNASISLETNYAFQGTFFARDVQVHQYTTVVALPFGWDRECVQFGCSAPDACHLPGACNMTTRACSNPVMPDPPATCDVRVTPLLLGLAQNGAGQTKAIFDYQTNAADVSIPYGPSNFFSASTGIVVKPSVYPPQEFTSRPHSPFAAPFDGTQLTWTVGSRSVTAYSSTQLLPTETGADGSRTAILPDGTRFNVDAVPPEQPTHAAEPPMGEKYNGTLAGKLAVTPSGAVTYTVPIAIPPGTAGMAPNLSLVYHSQAGSSGLAGQGWDLAGLSRIHRCAKTRAQDGVTKGVSLGHFDGDGGSNLNSTISDGICLDGMRLFYQDGVFVPERKDFSQISVSSDGQTFTIVTKSGETRFYGLHEESRVRVPSLTGSYGSGAIFIWALDEVMDQWGNFYRINYWAQDSRSQRRELVARSIDYSGHMTGNSVDLDPYFHVYFQYEDRPDVRRERYGWAELLQRKRIKNIRTAAGMYSLQYLSNGDPMLPTRLGSIHYCAGIDCLEPLVFEWDEGGFSWQRAPQYDPPALISNGGAATGTQLVDINGDGRVDIVDGVTRATYFNNGQSTCTGTGCAWTQAQLGTLPATSVDKERAFADMNGDGLPDVVFVDNSQSQCPIQVWLNQSRINGGGWSQSTLWEQTPQPEGTNTNPCPIHLNGTVASPNRAGRLADMNGDGLPDLVYVDSGNWLMVYFNTGSGWSAASNEYGRAPSGRADTVVGTGGLLISGWRLQDLNRDGRADLVYDDATERHSMFLNLGAASLSEYAWSYEASETNPFPINDKGTRAYGDVDGDGMWDLVQFQCGGPPEAEIRIGTGLGGLTKGYAGGTIDAERNSYLQALQAYGTLSAEPTCPAESLQFAFEMADLNADGLAEFILNHSLPPDTTGDTRRGQILVNTGSTWVDLDGRSGRSETAGTNGVPVTPIRMTLNAAFLYGFGTGTMIVDLDGDGVDDLVQADTILGGTSPTGGGAVPVRRAWLNTFRRPVIKAFPNGLARKTAVTYAVITSADAQDGTYEDSGSDNAASPRTFGVMPLRVAKYVDEDDGLGGTTGGRRTRYRYMDLRGSSEGRGPQGFAKVIVTTATSEVETTYSQVYPYTGQVLKVVRKALPSGVTLSETVNTYCDTTAVDAAGSQCRSQVARSTGDPFPPSTPTFVYPWKTVDATVMLSDITPIGATIATTVNQYDSWGNVRETRVEVVEAYPSSPPRTYSTSATNEYGTALATLRGKPTIVVTRAKRHGQTEISHTTAFDYEQRSTIMADGSAKLFLALNKKRIEPGRGEPIELHTAYGYDAWGNTVATTVCASDFSECTVGAAGPAALPFRTSRTSYDTADFNAPSGTGLVPVLDSYGSGRYPVESINAEGHVEFFAYDPFKGVMIQKTDANGIHSCYTYDSFGTKTADVLRCGSEAPMTTTYGRYRTTGFGYTAKTVAVTRLPDGGASWVYQDALGREIATSARAFEGGFVQTVKTYDAEGRLKTETKPWRTGVETAGPLTLYEYDTVNRLWKITQSLDDTGVGYGVSTSKTMAFNGTSVTTSQSVWGVMQTSTEVKDGSGKVATVVNSLGEAMSYEYDSDGNLKATTDPAGNHTAFYYDERGRKIMTVDPDTKGWTYTYNGFGDLVSQTDGKGQVTTMTYDRLGRMTNRTDSSGTTLWIYDVAEGGHGIGKLAAVVSAPDARLAGTCEFPSYVGTVDGRRTGRVYQYTAFGELAEVSECIDGEMFVTSHSYDALGREAVIQYPAVDGKRQVVSYNYNDLGFLQYITDLGPSVRGSVLWVATEVNALGQITREKYGNGVETVSTSNRAVGWLLQRTAKTRAGTELQKLSYRYDAVGNLRSRFRSDLSSADTSQEAFEYDELNRLTSTRTIVGADYDVTDNYAYDNVGNLTQKGGKTYAYGNCGAGPHAVCSVGSGEPLVYDVNGNMTSGLGRSLQYNASNMVTHVERVASAADGSGAGAVDFIYGADTTRVVQEVSPLLAGGGAKARTVYVGLGATGKSLYERTTVNDGESVEHAQFFYAPGSHRGNAFAVRVVTKGNSPSTRTSYYHFDHLGSVTALSDEAGSSDTSNESDSKSLGYDAWGARRLPDGHSKDPSYFKLQAGHREFTGHEAIPNVGLVNMNGRVYDPSLGRFLSPDPFIQTVTDLQSYNRYSYALNNPLRYTDPTGHFNYWGFAQQVGMMVGMAALAPYCPQCSVLIGFYMSARTMQVVVASGAGTGQIIATSVAMIGSTAVGAVGGNGGFALRTVLGGLSAEMMAAATSWDHGTGMDVLKAGLKGAAWSAASWCVGAALSQASAEGGARVTIRRVSRTAAAEHYDGGAGDVADGPGGFRRAPKELLGTREYYDFRSENAPDSYRNGDGPDYYLDYGRKYFDRFQALKARDPSLSSWVDRTAIELQQRLDDFLVDHPNAERERTSLFEAAMNTHNGAYRAGGFRQLSFWQQWKVAATIDMSDLFTGAGLKQVLLSADMLNGNPPMSPSSCGAGCYPPIR